MRRDVALIAADDAPAGDRARRFCKSRSLFLYVGDEEGRLLGVVDIHDIEESFPERELSSLVIAADLVTEIPFVTPLGAADVRQREALVPRPRPASGRRVGG